MLTLSQVGLLLILVCLRRIDEGGGTGWPGWLVLVGLGWVLVFLVGGIRLLLLHAKCKWGVESCFSRLLQL